MTKTSLTAAVVSISQLMTENRDYLIELDQQNGDGDLGVSMDNGFSALKKYMEETTELDLGKLLMAGARVFNDSAPSSLGTILSFGMMGMAKTLKGNEHSTFEETVNALEAGIALIMEKAKSKPGEKTILDAICPAVNTLKTSTNNKEGYTLAEKAAEAGSESTKEMVSVHGRAAYYGAKSIGVLDGGSVVGKLIFKGIAKTV